MVAAAVSGTDGSVVVSVLFAATFLTLPPFFRFRDNAEKASSSELEPSSEGRGAGGPLRWRIIVKIGKLQ
jgi:hypothetical protein